ncbi:antitoxin VapB family protein [Candidatus Micrarchaeota archaeon]|nr:antitoxin VapB family protein [Candidatus Micrarchaeota archaeon]
MDGIMGSVNISIKKDIYEKLRMLKQKDESFSDILLRLIEGGKDITRFAGVWKEMNKKEFENIASELKKARKTRWRKI